MTRRPRIETVELWGEGPRVIVSRTRTEPMACPPVVHLIPDRDPAIADANQFHIRVRRP